MRRMSPPSCLTRFASDSRSPAVPAAAEANCHETSQAYAPLLWLATEPGRPIRVRRGLTVTQMRDPAPLFEYAIEVTKQLLTLGSAVLALTLTVAREAPNGRRGFMLAGWVRVPALSHLRNREPLHADEGVRTPQLMDEMTPLRSDRGACAVPCSYRS